MPRFLTKLLLLSAAYFLINEPFIMDRVEFYSSVERWGKLISFLIQLGLTLILITFLSQTQRVVKWLFLLLFLINSMSYLTYYMAVGAPLTFSDFTVLFEARGMAGEAISGYQSLLFRVILLHIPFILLYCWSFGKELGIRGTVITFSFYVLVLIAYSFSLLNTQGRGLIGRPGFLLPTVQAMVYSYVNVQSSGINEALLPAERPKLSNLSVQDSGINTLIMVIDESINWDLLDLNYPSGVTPVLKQFSPRNILNFGKSLSYANCSDLSNASIRKFVRYGEEERDLLGTEKVYIWESARRAGYEPYLVDAQRNGIGHNYFTPQEIAQITVLQVDFEDDVLLIDLIKENRTAYPDEKQLYLVIKKGAHLPFYKEGIEEPFTPSMKTASLMNSSREEIMNTYKNRAKFETNQFFKRFLEEFEYQSDVALLYTSDHGQSFREPGKKSFHCDTRNPDLEEAVVPLMLIGPEYLANNSVIKNIIEHENFKSHYYIPSLLMAAMGYSDEDVESFTNYKSLEQSPLHFVYDRAVPFFNATAKKREVAKMKIKELEMQR